MSREDQLVKLVRQYFASKTSFNELAAWVQDNDGYWVTLPFDAPPRRLAARIMLMAYEVWEGKRPEDDAREPIREVATAAAGVS